MGTQLDLSALGSLFSIEVLVDAVNILVEPDNKV